MEEGYGEGGRRGGGGKNPYSQKTVSWIMVTIKNENKKNKNSQIRV